MIRSLSLAALAVLVAIPASACAPGAKCLTPPPDRVTKRIVVGEILPRGEYVMVMNATFYGLPPVPEGSLYFKVNRRVLRVDAETYEVLEDVTEQLNRRF